MAACEAFTRVGTRTRFDRVRSVVSWAETAVDSESESKRNNAAERELTGLAVILQHFIERMYELMRALRVFGSPAPLFFLQQVLFVGDVRGREDGEPDRVD